MRWLKNLFGGSDSQPNPIHAELERRIAFLQRAYVGTEPTRAWNLMIYAVEGLNDLSRELRTLDGQFIGGVGYCRVTNRFYAMSRKYDA